MDRAVQDPDDFLFEVFARFQRVGDDRPVFFCEPPEWAAAAHAIVVEDTVHYLWGRRKLGNYWVLMHSTAPANNPAAVRHDPGNPVLVPSREGFDDYTAEYPFPFWNPHDGKYYAYYLGRRREPPKQTGLLVGSSDLSQWTRVCSTPVIAADTEYEGKGSSHPSVAILDDTIHIIYTGESEQQPVICHATAPIHNPAAVTKNPANPIFRGSGQSWDSQGVREAEIFRGPRYFHLLYGGCDGNAWQIGHVRTRDFRYFEPNVGNPVFTPSVERQMWDCDSVLTPQVFQVGEVYYLLYAGKKGDEWQSGLARSDISGPIAATGDG